MSDYSSEKLPELKALILAGGRGKRLDAHTIEKNKCMLNFRGKPLIEYSLDIAKSLNVKEMVVVVGYLAEQIINAYGNSYKGTPIKYVIQKEQKGIVHAMECAKEAIAGHDFILLLGDEFLMNTNHQSFLANHLNENAFVSCGVVYVEDKSSISKTYSILFDKDSRRILRLIEKPRNPANNLMGTGNILFKSSVFDYTEKTPINQIRGERELPDLIQCLIDDGKKVTYHQLTSTFVNVNYPVDIDNDINVINKILYKNTTV